MKLQSKKYGVTDNDLVYDLMSERMRRTTRESPQIGYRCKMCIRGKQSLEYCVKTHYEENRAYRTRCYNCALRDFKTLKYCRAQGHIKEDRPAVNWLKCTFCLEANQTLQFCLLEKHY